jgi:hypothetical protein
MDYRGDARADLAQLVEHLICNQGVTGSSPVIGTSNFNDLAFHHTFHQALEKQLLREGESHDARNDDDDIDSGQVWP